MEKILFVSAQPDVPYFIWQIKIYVNNFIESGIEPQQIHVVLGLVNGEKTPSKNAEQLKELGINIHFFVDDIIFYNDLKLTKDELFNIFELTKCICFSLRLGLNTNICYTQQKLNKLENIK
jgi:hypothetical protein